MVALDQVDALALVGVGAILIGLFWVHPGLVLVAIGVALLRTASIL